MLTNTDWIQEGREFPPKREKKRIERYRGYSEMFAGEYDKVYNYDFNLKAVKLRMKDVEVSTAINYPQLLAKKTADFVCGEAPVIDVGDKDRDGALQNGLQTMGFQSALYEALIDVSRFGNAVVKILDDRVSVVPPRVWFPIVDEFDRKKITQHVLAFVSDNKIHVEIHDVGKYERRVYRKAETNEKGEGIVHFGPLEESETIQTGVDENAVQVLSNVTTTDSLFGISDYSIIKDAHRELIWRIFCAERILNKHAAPSIVGTSSMLEKDPITGVPIMRTGNFFLRDTADTPMPQYLTWDGNMSAVIWEIEWLTNQMYTLSEMGAAFLEGAGRGEVNSGRALRLRMTSPLIKAQRLTSINTTAVKKIVRLIAVALGLRLDIADVAVSWNDGLPNDIMDDLEIYQTASGGRPVMSQYTAVKSFNKLSDDATEEELATINAEIAALYRPQNEQ